MIRDPYFDIKSTSNSDLKYFKRSPEHYKHYKKHGISQTQAMVFGSALHAYMLENDKFNDMYIILDHDERPDQTKTMAAKENKAWENDLHITAQEHDMEVITFNDYMQIQLMADKLLSNPQSKELLEFSRNEYEKVLEWKWKGNKCKAKVDIINEVFLADLKTCQNADIPEFSRTMIKYEYYRQAGMYLDGDAGGHLNYGQRKDFFFIAIEKVEPFGVAVYKCSPDLIEKGVNEYRQLIEQLKECHKQDSWPSYDFKSIDGIHTVDLPFYLRD